MKPDYIITTGDVVQGWLEDNNVSLDSLSYALGITLEETQQLLSGDLHLSEHIANNLEAFTGTPARIWWLFEETYRKNTGECPLPITNALKASGLVCSLLTKE